MSNPEVSATMTITTATVPKVGRNFRIQWEPAQDAFVLLYPEGMVKLNQSAGEILKRCDGVASVADIVADLEKTFDTQGLEADVIGFIELAAQQNWVE
jgi:pyrroloquinoline quinone biosynthesis protein D